METFFTFLGIHLYYGFYVLLNKKSESIRDENEIGKLDYHSLNKKDLQYKIVNDIPVIIKNMPIEFFSKIQGGEMDPNVQDIKTMILPLLGKNLYHFITHFIQAIPFYIVRISGKYTKSKLHLDVFASFNMYYLKEGKKKVKIIPSHYTSVFEFNDCINRLEVLNSGDIEKLPFYYSFELEEGDVLIFNNSNCIHEFENISEIVDSYSIRFLTSRVADEIIQHDLLNLKMIKNSMTFRN
jgi:hypothetical protein